MVHWKLLRAVDRTGFLKISGTENDIDHNNCKGTFIIGAGFGRTGTSSLQIALNKLGWRSFHMREALKSKRKMRMLIKAAEIKLQLKETMKCSDSDNYKTVSKDIDNNWSEYVLNRDDFDWNQIFETDKDRFNATLDFPTCAFYQELMRYYAPNYKVILTVRDNENVWFHSIKQSIAIGEKMVRDRWVLRYLFSPAYKMQCKCLGDIIFGGKYDSQNIWWDNEENVKRTYNEWIENVKKNVPKDKLLIFNVKQGWVPLCDFLGIKEIPNEPFPRSNESQKMKSGFKCIAITARIVNTIFIFVFGVILYMLFNQIL